MQPITVAIADEDAGRRIRFELSLQDKQGVRVLANITSCEDVVTSTRRHNPRILLANLKQCTENDGALLTSLRRECPETLVVLLADESVQQEEQIMQALVRGARGYLNLEADPILISKAVHIINRGEAWVPRKMLGKLMDEVLHWCH